MKMDRLKKIQNTKFLNFEKRSRLTKKLNIPILVSEQNSSKTQHREYECSILEK